MRIYFVGLIGYGRWKVMIVKCVWIVENKKRKYSDSPNHFLPSTYQLAAYVQNRMSKGGITFHKLIKAKPIVRWGRKTTGLQRLGNRG